MKIIKDKKISVKRLSLIIIFIISTLCMQAGSADKYKKLITKEFGSFEGIYIMGGLIVVGLGIYLISNHYSKKKDKLEREKQKQQLSNNPQIHARRAQRRAVRKTS
jgi:hypothetical protein